MAVLKVKNEETQEFEVLEVICGKEGEQGPKGEDGYTPQKGIDYFTEEEIDEIASLLINNLPSAEEEAF